MRSRRFYITGGVVVAAVVAVVALAAVLLLSGSDGKAGSEATNDAGTTGAPQSQAVHESSPGGATSEGIAVHGHWQIEIKDPDGRLVESREFENALTSQGKTQLSFLLSRQAGLPAYAILLRSDPDTGPCDADHTDGVPLDCMLGEAAGGPPAIGATLFTTLTVSRIDATEELQLQGTAIANNDGSIKDVGTEMCLSLPPSLDPAAWH